MKWTQSKWAQTDKIPLKTNTYQTDRENAHPQAKLINMTSSPNKASAKANCKIMDRIWFWTNTYSRTSKLINDLHHPNHIVLRMKILSESASKRSKRKEMKTTMLPVPLNPERAKNPAVLWPPVPKIILGSPRNLANQKTASSAKVETKSQEMRRSEAWLLQNRSFSTQIERSHQLEQAPTQVLRPFKRNLSPKCHLRDWHQAALGRLEQRGKRMRPKRRRSKRYHRLNFKKACLISMENLTQWSKK